MKAPVLWRCAQAQYLCLDCQAPRAWSHASVRIRIPIMQVTLVMLVSRNVISRSSGSQVLRVGSLSGRGISSPVGSYRNSLQCGAKRVHPIPKWEDISSTTSWLLCSRSRCHASVSLTRIRMPRDFIEPGRKANAACRIPETTGWLRWSPRCKK